LSAGSRGLDVLNNVVSAIAKTVASEGAPTGEACRSWISDLNAVPVGRSEALARLIGENRLTLPAYTMLEGQGSEISKSLRRSLEGTAKQMEVAGRDRDRQLAKLVDVLTKSGINYVVFKTFNRTGWVGVDLDVLIGKADYRDCVEGLLAGGYYSIDDLAKEYATGFMSKGNPVIVDLHTQLAVLGVPYFSSNTLLADFERSNIGLPEGRGNVAFNQLGETTETVVRMAHAVIKEGIVTAGEVAEVLPGVGREGISRLIARENLQLAGSVFGYSAEETMDERRFGGIVKFNESAIHGLAKGMLDEALRRPSLPCRMPANVSLLSLLDRLQAEGEISISLPTLMRNLAYRRNAAYLGHTLLERLGIS
jgi:hypothetical protein